MASARSANVCAVPAAKNASAIASRSGPLIATPVEVPDVVTGGKGLGAGYAPLGASVGPAGLATMPYEVTFKGDFFAIADFLDA